MTPSLFEPFCFPESRETPYSVVTNGSVIHPLSLNYRSQFFWPRFAQAYGSICTLYNSTPQFTSGIYYNGLRAISSLTPAALSREARGNKRAVQSGSNSAHPQFPQIFFFFHLHPCSLQNYLPPPPCNNIFSLYLAMLLSVCVRDSFLCY